MYIFILSLINGQEFHFSINTQKAIGNAYVDANLMNDLPDDFKQLLGNFHFPIVLGFYTSQDKTDDNTMGKTNYQQKLVTESGICDRFTYVRINRKYSDKGYNMANTIIHELGHAIIAEIELNLDLDWSSSCFISNNNLVISDIINQIAQQNMGNNYGYIYQSISDYASSNLAEIPSEAFAQVYLAPETATDFNKVFVAKMLELWQQIE